MLTVSLPSLSPALSGLLRRSLWPSSYLASLRNSGLKTLSARGMALVRLTLAQFWVICHFMTNDSAQLCLVTYVTRLRPESWGRYGFYGYKHKRSNGVCPDNR